LAGHERLRFDQRGADGFAAGHFADAGVARAVLRITRFRVNSVHARRSG